MTTITEEEDDQRQLSCDACGETTGDVKNRPSGQLCQACYEELQHDEPEWLLDK